MTCRWLKHRYLPYTYVSKKIKSGEGGRGSYQSCVGHKQVRTSVLLSFEKIMKKETLNPRFFFMSTSERFTLFFIKTINPVCLLKKKICLFLKIILFYVFFNNIKTFFLHQCHCSVVLFSDEINQTADKKMTIFQLDQNYPNLWNVSIVSFVEFIRYDNPRL